jgi:Helix-hairpin-helix motif
MYKTKIAAIFVVILALSGAVASAQEAGSAKVNVNTATPEELAHLPGMTKSKAAKLVAGRPYASADDLSKSGLTAKQIEKIKPLVGYEGGAASAAPPATAATTATGAPSTAKPEHARKARNTASTGSASAESCDCSGAAPTGNGLGECEEQSLPRRG